MPFTSVIDSTRRLVITRGTGALTGNEALASCVQLKKEPEFDPSFNQLLDLTTATGLDATSEQIKRAASEPMFSKASRRAIVAHDSGVFGLARMFETYHNLSGVGEQVMVFRDMHEALDWLHSATAHRAHH